MRRTVRIFAVLGAASASPAMALDVTFAGVVVDTCTIALSTPGVMVLSSDGTILGSDQSLGVPAAVAVVSIGSNTISLSAPELVSHPGGYTPGGETVEMAYSGLASNPLFSSLALDFDIGLLSLQTLFVDLRVDNPDGFVQGNYTARTVLTCS